MSCAFNVLRGTAIYVFTEALLPSSGFVFIYFLHSENLLSRVHHIKIAMLFKSRNWSMGEAEGRCDRSLGFMKITTKLHTHTKLVLVTRRKLVQVNGLGVARSGFCVWKDYDELSSALVHQPNFPGSELFNPKCTSFTPGSGSWISGF